MTNKTFNNLIKCFENLKKEEVLILFLHSCLLEENFDYDIQNNNESNDDNLKNKDIYIKNINEDGSFYINKILIDSKWRNNTNSYIFYYKFGLKNEKKISLNILKVNNNSLIIQLLNALERKCMESITIKINDYINDVNNIENIKLNQLKEIFYKNILLKIELDININSNKNQCLIHNNQKIDNKIDQSNRYINNITNDIFDDKNPNIYERNLNIKDDLLLKPDGLYFGPNQRFFNNKFRYDPIGPFGLEPDSDKKNIFEFKNQFPF